MGEIAVESGLSIRTLFRYFPAKGELVWGGLAELLRRLQHELEAVDGEADPFDAVKIAYVRAITLPDEAIEITRQRLLLIDSSPSLYAYGIPKWEQGRQLVARFLARRTGLHVDDLAVYIAARELISTGHGALVWWARFSVAEPHEVVDAALRGRHRAGGHAPLRTEKFACGGEGLG